MDTYTDKSMQKRGEGMLLTTAVIFGSFGVLAKLLGDTFGSAQLAFLVNFAQFFYFSYVSFRDRDMLKVKKTTKTALFAFVVLNLLPLFFFINAVQWLGIGAVLLVQNTVTLFTSLYLDFARTKQVSPIHLSLTVIALAALAIIYLPFDINSSIGFLFAFGVGLCNALANNFRQKLSADYSPQQLSLFSSTAGTFVWGITALVFASFAQVAFNNWIPWLLVLYAGLNIVTTFFLNKGFASVPLTLGNVILLLEIVIGYGLGALVFGESYGLYQAVGSIILFSAIFGMRVVPQQQSAR
jgi:drug/metabolite transporter (DMT)-like permease